MKITLIRHATLGLEYGGLTWLIDPMLAEPGAYPPFPNTPNDRRNPLLCQPGDEEAIRGTGFTSVTAVRDTQEYHGITLTRTGGRHGTGEIGERMGRVSGFVFRAAGEPTLYIAGDTIWCEEVREALNLHRPEVAVVNAGGARFTTGEPITMDAGDIASVSRHAPDTRFIAVHMDAINHCLTTRENLRQYLAAEGLTGRVLVPEDGEWISEP
ncbi:L-ascorbate metabolism protein UlaG (beta-lactamase superfamily) [Fontibacillus phaseoli]|uniref:L-ascorbate metabolism protein UlaG (Beta-lactamase superfamily) n=1 Tax=Fontibacillus phaseoli TaxID=1416533 RepID=A0A369BFN0_9BACL|nr:MBL fold metallo-hydrolase [Fontibacillus phaseoli]RCX18504.1 L-ascorbate metabolism protein UlaG (beta-lactamase superfamily) [Fontibacillus phaseoli]